MFNNGQVQNPRSSYGVLVAVHEAMRFTVHEAMRFSVDEVMRFHTASLRMCYRKLRPNRHARRDGDGLRESAGPYGRTPRGYLLDVLLRRFTPNLRKALIKYLPRRVPQPPWAEHLVSLQAGRGDGDTAALCLRAQVRPQPAVDRQPTRNRVQTLSRNSISCCCEPPYWPGIG